MSSSNEQHSPIVRFFETFFQEQNIKWMLGVGMLILVGSSLMLVTSHWDTYTPLWKSIILLGYTIGVHLAGQISFHSLGLRKTGTVLMALTVLLIPLGFHALRWNFSADFGRQSTSLLLLAGNGVFATVAARKIFNHFLRSTQTTFLASYGILCVASTLLPLVPVGAAPWLALSLWGVFAAGAIKVNRHVFWLTEEYRLPRICGFFPILLLGGQFLTLFATSVVNSTSLLDTIAVEWIGIGLVLTAIPVLLTADALARVFLQVHGQVTRPLPYGIVLPILAGLALMTTGVCVSAIGFPNAVSLVPASALAATMLAVIARRTEKSVFVWAMLGGVLMAYQCSPVFFRELAGQIIQHGAVAVGETRLPLAFYGLTYLPLLVVLSFAAKWRQRVGDDVFAIPIRRFAVGLGVVLLAIAATHLKALFLVSLATLALFSLQAILFRDRCLVGLGIVAWVIATASCYSFLTDVLAVRESVELSWLTLVVSAGSLLWPGVLIDRGVANWRSVAQKKDRENSLNVTDVTEATVVGEIALCETTSRWASLLLAAGWLGSSMMTLPLVASVSGGLLAVLLLIHTVRVQARWLAEVTLGFVTAFTVIQMLAMHGSIVTVSTVVTAMLFLLWNVVPQIRRRAFTAFAAAGPRVAAVGFLMLGLGVVVPGWVNTFINGHSFQLWVAAIGSMVWTFAAARKHQKAWLVVPGWFMLLANVGAIAFALLDVHEARQWLPAIWGTVSVLAVLAAKLRPREPVDAGASGRVLNQNSNTVAQTLHGCTLTTLGLTATLSLLFFNFPIRIAGGIALAGLLLIASQRRQPVMRTVSLMLVSWQTLCAVVQVFVPEAETVFDLSIEILVPALMPLALLASWLIVVWQYGLLRATSHDLTSQASSDAVELIGLQRALLRVVTGAALISILFASTFEPLTVTSVAMITMTFLVLAADSVITGHRLNRQSLVDETSFAGPRRPDEDGHSTGGNIRVAAQGRVWAALVILAAGVAHLAFCGAIAIGNGTSMFVVLGTGLLAWTISQLAARSAKSEFLTLPLAITGQCLPAVTVVIGVGRHLLERDALWLGVNSLALLMAAAFYFWRGLERRNSSLLIGSAAIVNVALTLLWSELDWSDPQFFMIPLGISLLGLVELLRSEIPAKSLNPLRYAGALVILVSPTFHIVGGSWLHLFSLMVASVSVTLLAMGLRVRALMYTGVGFLVADLIAMLVRGSIDNPGILWMAGISFGTLVIGLAAYCERHREKLLQRMRLVAAQLDAWD
ncbi:MAG: hypothetical protein HQ518_16280 [Rhodopirellula sp.]|nr:hypothetical protein [Rhodopirellula sp.]